MRVLIFEPQFMGHNLVHVARLVRAVAELPCQTFVATSRQAIESAEYRLHLAGEADRFRLVALDGFQTDPHARKVQTNGVAAAAVYRGLTSAIERVRPDHVYVPYGNLLARIGALPLGLGRALRRTDAEAEVLLVGGRYLYPTKSPLKRLRQQLTIEMISRGPWTSVFHLDDAAVDQLQAHSPRMARLAKPLPEPIGEFPKLDRVAARQAIGLPQDGRLLGVVGLIEPRKGIDLLLDAMRASGERLRPNDRLALVGPFRPDVHELLRSRHADQLDAGCIVTIDRRLSEGEMATAAAALDVVTTVYPHHPYASGVLVAAAAMGRPVLGSDSGWIGRTIERFELGHACDPADPRGVREKLLASLGASDRYALSPAGRRFVEYVGDRNYAATWTARLRERLGVAPSPELRTWQWALGEEATRPRAAA